MAFTAHIDSIQPTNDGSGNVQLTVVVTFNDSVTLFTTTKTYTFPITTTQAAAVTQITADGNTYKSSLATISNLQSKVGTVINI